MLSDVEAKRIVDELGEEMGLAPIERLAVRLVAKHETQYGAGWDAKNKPPRPERGAGSFNMGADTTTSTAPGTFFVHGDSRFDPETGKVIGYETKFAKYPSAKEGFRGLARVLLFKDGQRRPNIARALELGSLLEFVTAMRMNRYFLGVKPIQEAIEDYRAALERRYLEIKASTAESFFDGPKATAPGSHGASASGQASPSSQSVPRFLRQLSVSLPVLRRGSRGDLVGVLQFQLGLHPDEVFGPVTEAKLVEWQKAHGLTSDIAPSGKPYALGACGVRTWAALFDVGPGDEDESTYDAPELHAALIRAWQPGDDDEPTIA